VAVSFTSKRKKEQFEAKFEKFSQSAELRVGDDAIKLCFAYYEYTPTSLTLEFFG
jgi:hypothetical protein